MLCLLYVFVYKCHLWNHCIYLFSGALYSLWKFNKCAVPYGPWGRFTICFKFNSYLSNLCVYIFRGALYSLYKIKNMLFHTIPEVDLRYILNLTVTCQTSSVLTFSVAPGTTFPNVKIPPQFACFEQTLFLSYLPNLTSFVSLYLFSIFCCLSAKTNT